MSEEPPRRPPHAGPIPVVPPAGPIPVLPPPGPRPNTWAARNVLRRLVQGEAPPTAPMNIVERLAGSPYANPTIQVGKAEESARKTIDFALRLAETMFRYGAGAMEVETSIIAVTAALGLRNIEVDITNQSVVINYARKDTTPVTLLRVVRSWTNNYDGLVQVHELVTDIVSGGVTRDDAYKRLDAVIRSPKPFPRWMVALAEAVFAAAVVGVIGGSWVGVLVSFPTILLVGLIARTLGRWRVPDFFVTAISSFTVTMVAVACYVLEVPLSPSAVVAGGILLLLPTGRLVSAVQDAINGFPVTAAGRFLSAFLSFGAIVSGIAVAIVIAAAFGKSRLDVAEPLVGAHPLYVLLPLVAVATIAICVAEQTAVRLLVPTLVTALAGYLAYYFALQLGLGGRFAPAVAAVVVGVLARVIALRLGAPQLVVAVPSIIFLLVGLSIFRAMFTITLTPAATAAGTVDLVNALIVILAVAAGVVFGDNVARPLTRGNGRLDRRANRRR
ncbi:threonine/serine ThrE exporter family protein [Specibacter cremeus]|uniref:threonine/serine ThrE exporter family protein n=1 Tax=Specibacter cremeus TaxID=1629051 RepID=UPI000F793B16|nr:threonine/serine exporter family protein [Specibacter cremeus]